MARKSLYNKKTWPNRAYKYASLGQNDKEISKSFGITAETFYQYIKKHPEFSDAITEARFEHLPEVEGTLLKCVNGFFEYETHTEYRIEKDGTRIPYSEKKIKKYYPPNPQLLQFFLRTAYPDKYQEKQEIQHNVKVEPVKIIFKK